MSLRTEAGGMNVLNKNVRFGRVLPRKRANSLSHRSCCRLERESLGMYSLEQLATCLPQARKELRFIRSAEEYAPH